MRAIPLILLLPLLQACAPDIDGRLRCSDDSECFLGERCLANACTIASGSADGTDDGKGPGEPDAAADVAAIDSTVDSADAADPDTGADAEPLPDGGDAGGTPVPDASPADAGTPDAGIGAEAEIVISVVLSSLDAVAGGHVDIGFCPDPATTTPDGPLAGVPSCDDAVFLRVTKASGATVQVVGMETSKGEVTAKSQPIGPSSDEPVSITLRSTANLRQPTAKVDVLLTATSKGLKLSWTGQTESRHLARFGAWNLETAVPCLAAKDFEGTLSEVSVAINGNPIALQALRSEHLSKMGTWTPGVSWIDFAVDACKAQYFLLQIGDP